MTGTSLRDIRRALGMTQDELAARWGLRGRQTISEWERGVYPVPQWVRDALDGIAATRTTVRTPCACGTTDADALACPHWTT